MGHLVHAQTVTTFSPTWYIMIYHTQLVHAQTVTTFSPTWHIMIYHTQLVHAQTVTTTWHIMRLLIINPLPQDKSSHSPPPSKLILEDVFVCNYLGGPQSEVSKELVES